MLLRRCCDRLQCSRVLKNAERAAFARAKHQRGQLQCSRVLKNAERPGRVLYRDRRDPLQCSRVLKNAESLRGLQAKNARCVASMQPRSEERGEFIPRVDNRPMILDASMQPRSEERGE